MVLNSDLNTGQKVSKYESRIQMPIKNLTFPYRTQFTIWIADYSKIQIPTEL